MYPHNLRVRCKFTLTCMLNLCSFVILPTNQISGFAEHLERLNKVQEILKIP